MSRSLVVVGLNHRTAPVELRERLAVPPDGLEQTAHELKGLPHVREAMVVATCNRVEIYAAGDEAGACVRDIRGFFAARAPGADVSECLYEHRGPAAGRHVFRVASSLDSMVGGEPQILGQVKEAFHAARDAGSLGPELSRALSRAFAAAKRVRSETQIGTGTVSVASVAVDLAQQIFGEIAMRRVLLVGAGKMALMATRALLKKGARLSIVNRHYERALDVAKAHGGEAHPLESLELLLPHVDVVLCSTGAQRFVITKEIVQRAMKARRGRSLFLIDIAVPRNIDPRVNDVDSVYLFDVDDLEREVARAIETRGGSLSMAERIVDEEIRAFERDRAVGSAAPTIAALREHFRRLAQAEIEKSFAGKLKHLGEGDRSLVQAMVESALNKLLHAPTTALRASTEQGEREALSTVVQALFQLPNALREPAPEKPAPATPTEDGEDPS